ncbi:unnamed protein product [Owenia fusiformis]|uniref:Protein Wnt n=1 Tax=Owenia fusiformis TaxID=6347 RepID=A0A8J1UJT3_OWEFU|nr:unnamed protein product [Owenia fusiformis]
MKTLLWIKVMLVYFVNSATCYRGNAIIGLNIPTEPTLDPNTVCKTYPDLNPMQYALCSRYPDVTASAIQGIQIAIHECQYQFKRHRWNCSTLETKNKNPHSSPLLSKGFRETAFAYAVSSAGVTSQVARACSLGKLKSCGCDLSNDGRRAKQWEWGGCSHNIHWGDKFAQKFLDSKETSAKDIHSRINLHNNKVGRIMVHKHVQTKCKCHGMSGSCELKTCWKAAPEFRGIGESLKEKYNAATQVANSNSVEGKLSLLYPSFKKEPYDTDLVYFEKSPNFCDKNHKVDSPGTSGRLCNKSSNGIDNCETLCCGRGYNTLRVVRNERCHCKFHWCCYVICQKCVYNEWVTVCK